jgi:hypothetical protein
MSTDWNIQEAAHTCTACKKDFSDGEALFSRLQFGAEGYARQDYCAVCWSDPARTGATGVWKGVYRAPAPPPEEPLKKETAESLLRHLMETEDEKHGNAIFILAVMLERRRILAERDVQTRADGVKIRVYEHKKTNETFFIPDPQLKLAALEHVQEEVVTLLGGKPKQAEEKAATDEHGSNTAGT